MKVVEKSARPLELSSFDTPQALGSWENFKGVFRDEYFALRRALFRDQRGICAYCEIDLIIDPANGNPDFRIEHFHPQSDGSSNWRYDWNNLFAVCGGGNVRFIEGQEERFTAPDLSCDAWKGDSIVDGLIFNPMDEALLGAIFEFQENGRMQVATSCPDHLKELARDTIKHLNLSGSEGCGRRLDRLRQGVINGLRQQVQSQLAVGAGIEEIFAELADALFPDDESKPWPAFFSCIRWYLGDAANSRLVQVGYFGGDRE